MPHDRLSVAKLEAEWRIRLQEAQTRYQSAVKHQHRMVEELGQDVISLADGSFAIAQARRAAAWARNEVVRTLSIYVDVMAREKMPPPDDDEKLLI